MTNAKRWPIVFYESPEAAEAAGARFTPGTCFPDFMSVRFPKSCVLSEKYKRDHATKRPPLCIVCPGPAYWPIDCLASNEKGSHGEGWTITGDHQAGTLHASPSIHFPGTYHGWLHAGFLSDDIDGKKHADDGTPL